MALTTWDLDTVHSSVSFSVRHMVVAKTRGHFGKWSATLEIDPENFAASKVSAKIDAVSIATNEEKRDAHLRSADFLEVEKHPNIDFKSSAFEVVSKDSLRIKGQLSIRGVTKDIVLDTEFGGLAKDLWGGERIGFTARTKIDRKDFGLVWNQALEAGGLLVGDAVEIAIELEASRKL